MPDRSTDQPRSRKGPPSSKGPRKGPSSGKPGGPRGGPKKKGGPRGGKPPPAGPPEVRRVGEPKGEHGTLTLRRIRCARCKKVEHIQGAPRDKTTAYCRACAEEALSIYEAGVEAKRPTVRACCAQCGVTFEIPVSAREKLDDADVLCLDCLRGFASWQGAIDRPATREKELGEPRRPGVRLRKR